MKSTRMSIFAVMAFMLPLAVLSPQQASAQARVLTVAGGAVNDGGPATSAALANPEFAAYDNRGNLYIAEYFGHRIRKVSPSGTISTIAGNGISGYNGDGGPAKAALVSFPIGILVDPSGNILFSDDGNNRVRKIDTQGVITTIAGNGTSGFSGDGGLATSASLSGGWGLSLGPSGNLYIADNGNERIRVVNRAGIIHTVAGNGTAGFSGDGGPAVEASINFPTGVFADSSGSLYIADYSNQRIRKVDSSGVINTFAGNGSFGCAGDGGLAQAAAIGGAGGGFQLNGNNLLISSNGCGRVRTVDLTTNIITTYAGSTTGFNGDGNSFVTTEFQTPRGLFTNAIGDTVMVDHFGDRVRVLTSNTQTVSTIAGGFIGDGGLGTGSSLNIPVGINFDSANNLYIADSENNRVRILSSTGTIATFAGTGITGYTGDGGPATLATLSLPQAVAADRSGNVFIADQGGIVLREVNAGGTISSVALTGGGFVLAISALATDSAGNIYVADPDSCVVWRVSVSGFVSAIAGKPLQCGFNGDGIPGKQALLNIPFGVAVDSKGNVYIGDSYNNRVRIVSRATGLINTVAGNGTCGFSGDGGPATTAMLCTEYGIAVDSHGNLYIADLGNGRVRSVDSAGVIQTIAGTGSFAGYNGNGLPATQTNLDFVDAVAVNGAGVAYLGDEIQNRIRKIH